MIEHVRQEQDTIQKDQVDWKKNQIELLETKDVFTAIKCSTVELNIQWGTMEMRL